MNSSFVSPPKNEKLWVTCKDAEGNIRYIITSKVDDRTLYFLHSWDGGKLVRVGKNKEVSALYKIMDTNK